MGEGGDEFTGHKPHRSAQKGRKAEKKEKGKKESQEGVDPRIRNPKAFAINSAVRAERKFRRAQDLETKKDRVPLVDRTPVEAPPFIIAIVGPPKVGKSTLFMNIVRNYTRQNLTDIKGPVTIVTGKKRRLTIIECNNDIHSMIDVAKIADLVLLLVDASFGFEMEIFEFLNICQVHGFPQIMGVLTHLDMFKNKKKLKKAKKTLKHRFWTEVYPGSKLFYLSGYFPMTNTYPKNEVHNLARFISVMKFRPTVWRSEHAYVVADRMEDLTSVEHIRVNPKVDRRISLYGWVHGTFLKQHVSVHIPGLGDFTPDAITSLPDPCPLPLKERTLRRSLNEKEKIMYAPFSGVGGIVYDQDAVYIDLGGSHSHTAAQKSAESQDEPEKGNFVGELRELKSTLDEKMDSAGLQLFSGSEAITGADVNGLSQMEIDEIEEVDNEEVAEQDQASQGFSKNFTSIIADDGRVRRKVLFNDEDQSLKDDDENEDVTQSIHKEISQLKKSGWNERNEAVSEGSENESSSEDESEDEDSEVQVESSSHALKSKGIAIPEKKEIYAASENEQSMASLVTKIKSKLKSKETSQSENKQEAEKASFKKPTNKISPEVEFDDNSDEDDDVNEENELNDSELDDDIDDDEEMASDPESEEGDSISDDEEVPPSISSKDRKNKDSSAEDEKEQRYAIAEESFYSRHRNRSIQKRIYDDTEDYMNVTSRADFDLANCAIKEQTQMLDEDSIKDLFIGGDYAETAKNILDAEGDSDEDVFGDFEALDDDDDDGDISNKKETKGSKKSSQPEDEEVTKKKRDELKKKLKEKFDIDYDDGGDEKSFYRNWKAQVEEQTMINQNHFKDVDDPNLLRDLQGLAPGSYVRVEISRIPCEFVTKFDPQRNCPLVVGSLDSPNQETLAVVQARVKKHRWHPKILKTRDPIVMSIGWRRFQTVVLFSVQDHNMRNRMIKYTPDHLHCIANFYGPMTPQGTGILGIAPTGFDGFKITLTGTILDMDKSSELVKKLKLVGTPHKVLKKSAVIEGMFSSQLEVAKFVGAKIKTVSGIRGVIKKEWRPVVGAFRATFEDKILQSDIVFCRTWAKVDVPPFYLNLPTHIIAQPRLMKTMGQLKRERDIQVQPNPDNLYTPVEREAKRFRPLKIPKSLQEKLPYMEKPKILAKLNAPKRIAVIKDPHERKMTKFLRTLKTRMDEKDAKEKSEKAKKAAAREKVMKKVEERQNQRQKELRKKVFRTLGLIHKSADSPGGGNRPRPPKHKRK